MEVADGADAGGNRGGHGAEDRDHRCGAGRADRHGLEGEGLERVAGENGGGFAEDDVAGRLAAAKIVVVERGQVIVDEGVGVEHLQRGSELGCSGRYVAGDHAGGFKCQDRPETLAAGEGGVAHGAMNGMWKGVRGGEQAFKGLIGQLGSCAEQGVYVDGRGGRHCFHDNGCHTRQEEFSV